MTQSIRGARGMAVAPHSLAAQSALAILREGGNAIEAMIAASATVAVVYPHMNSIGGDAFWLIHVPGEAPGVIDACGAAARAASIGWYQGHGSRETIPVRGGLAANTVAGLVSGWDAAYRLSRRALRGRLPFARLLEDAVYYADRGFAVTASQSAATAAKSVELAQQPGFAETYLADGVPPAAGTLFVQKKLAATLRRLARAGAPDFYRGELARSLARDLEEAGSPLTLADLAAHRARLCDPLRLRHSLGDVFNLPPPTQGVVSLLILGMLDSLEIGKTGSGTADYVHLSVEAAKQAFRVRDRYVTDPAYMRIDARELLRRENIGRLAAGIARYRAAPWKSGRAPADTVWLGAVDGRGCAVSCIQSLYHEFGSGIVLRESGISWQNRGCSFSLDPQALNPIAPRRKPFHTLNPALARIRDGRVMVYGTMGGDGQPQTQAAVFTRVAVFGMDPQSAVSAPRWLLGRTWGQGTDTLKLESRFEGGLLKSLGEWGHDIEILQPFDEAVGHAGCIVVHPGGVMEGGADPRSDGTVAAF